MNKTPVDWEEFEAQSVLIQRLIADQLTSPESPHYITRLTEPANLIKLNVDSPIIQLPASSFSLKTESCKAQTFHLKSLEAPDLRSPLKNVTNSSCNNSTPEKHNSEALPSSCPTSAEFKEFLSQIAEVSLVSQDSVHDSSKDDSLLHPEKNHARKGTYDVDGKDSKTEAGETSKSITRGRIGTFNTTPTSSLLASLLKQIGDEKKDDNVFSEEGTIVVKPDRCLIPPGLARCSLDDSDTDLSSSDESLEHDQVKEAIPEAELLVVVDEVPSKKCPAKSKKKSKLIGSKIKSHGSCIEASKGADATASHVSVEKANPVDLQEKETVCKERAPAPASYDDGSVQCVSDCLPVIQEASLQNAHESGVASENANATSVACESGTNASLGRSYLGGGATSSRLIPKQASTLGTMRLNLDPKPPSKMTKMNVLAKRSSLSQPLQAKAAVDTSDRRSLDANAPTVKPALLKPGRLQSKLGVAKKALLGTSGTKEESEVTGSDTVRPADSILSKTVTKTQPAVSKLLQRSSKLQPPQQTREIKCPNKALAQTSAVGHMSEAKVNTVSRLSLLPSKPSLGRCLPPPPKALPKPPVESTKTVPEPARAGPELKAPHVAIKAPLTATKTLRLVRPGFTNAAPLIAVSATNSNRSMNEPEKDVEQAVNQKPVDTRLSEPGEVSTKSIAQALRRKGPAPVKAIFQPSGPQAEGSRTVTKEKNDTSRLSTKGEQPDLSKTVTKVKPEDGTRTVTLASGNSLSPTTRAESQFTPMKSEKVFNPRRLSDVFQNTGSPDSIDVEIKGRASKIPTPRSSRFSSQSSAGSNASISLFRKPSDFESPFPGRKESTENSLSAFKPRRALVRYTPDVEPRRQSMWSPVKKKLLPDDDMAHLCTKKLRPGLEGSL